MQKQPRIFQQVTRSLIIFVMFVLAMPSAPAWARNAGVELYTQQKYKEAGEVFQKELARRGDSAALHFDVGTAAYKTAQYEKALESFSKALAGADAKLQPKSEYNLGNTLYQIGAGKTEKDAKLKEWHGALEHYEQALKLEPQNADAKHNREAVGRMVEELEKQKKEDEKKQEQEKQQQQQSQKSEQKDQQPKKDGEQPEQKEQPQKKDDGKKSEQQSKSEQQDDKNQEQKNQSGGEKKDSEQQQQKQQQGKDDKGEQKDGEQKQQENSSKDEKRSGDGSKQGQPQTPPEKPNPANAPPPSDKRFAGDVKAAQPQDKGENEKAQPAEIAEGEVKEGEMSKGQAMSLLESLKGDDERVTLTERKRATRVGKDW